MVIITNGISSPMEAGGGGEGDLSPWEPFRWPWHGEPDGMVDPVSVAGGALTAVFEATSMSFASAEGVQRAANGIPVEIETVVMTEGCLQAVAFWFRLDLAPGVSLSTGAGSRETGGHWLQAVQRLPEDIAVQAGDTITVTVTATCDGIDFAVACPPGRRAAPRRLPPGAWIAQQEKLDASAERMIEAASKDPELRTRLAAAALEASMRPCGVAGVSVAGGSRVASEEATLLWRSLHV